MTYNTLVSIYSQDYQVSQSFKLLDINKTKKGRLKECLIHESRIDLKNIKKVLWKFEHPCTKLNQTTSYGKQEEPFLYEGSFHVSVALW